MRNPKATFGDGPYPFPIESAREIFHVYESDTILMLDLKSTVKLDLYPGSHYHTDYEFMITDSPLEHIGVENKEIKLKSNQMLLIQSDQPHGPTGVMPQIQFFSISIEKEFFETLGKSLSRNKSLDYRNDRWMLTPEIESSIQLFMRESQAKQMGYGMILQCLSTQLAISILRQTFSLKEDSAPFVNILDPNIKKTIEMLQDSYNQD